MIYKETLVGTNRFLPVIHTGAALNAKVVYVPLCLDDLVLYVPNCFEETWADICIYFFQIEKKVQVVQKFFLMKDADLPIFCTVSTMKRASASEHLVLA